MRKSDVQRRWPIWLGVSFVAAAVSVACIYTAGLDFGPSIGAEVWGLHVPTKPPLWLITFVSLAAAALATLLAGGVAVIACLILNRSPFAAVDAKHTYRGNDNIY